MSRCALELGSSESIFSKCAMTMGMQDGGRQARGGAINLDRLVCACYDEARAEKEATAGAAVDG